MKSWLCPLAGSTLSSASWRGRTTQASITGSYVRGRQGGAGGHVEHDDRIERSALAQRLRVEPERNRGRRDLDRIGSQRDDDAYCEALVSAPSRLATLIATTSRGRSTVRSWRHCQRQSGQIPGRQEPAAVAAPDPCRQAGRLRQAAHDDERHAVRPGGACVRQSEVQRHRTGRRRRDRRHDLVVSRGRGRFRRLAERARQIVDRGRLATGPEHARQRARADITDAGRQMHLPDRGQIDDQLVAARSTRGNRARRTRRGFADAASERYPPGSASRRATRSLTATGPSCARRRQMLSGNLERASAIRKVAPLGDVISSSLPNATTSTAQSSASRSFAAAISGCGPMPSMASIQASSTPSRPDPR